MSQDSFQFTGKLERWTGTTTATWHFIMISGDVADQISGIAVMRRLESGKRAGFGSVKVTVTVGDTSWKTSVFPTKEKTWFLPIKKPVRIAEDIAEGDAFTLTLEV